MGIAPSSTCPDCQLGKGTKDPYPTSTNPKAQQPFEVLYADLFGPVTPPTFTGARFGAVFVDEFSSAIFTFIIDHKSQAPQCLQKVIEYARHHNREIKFLQTDDDTVFKSQAINSSYVEHGIKHLRSTPYTPQQNGAAERAVRLVCETANTLMQHAGIDRRLWGDAVLTAGYLLNRSWRRRKGATPYELLVGKQPDLSNLKVFGSPAYTHIGRGQRDWKFGDHSRLEIFVGYPEDRKAWRFFDPVTGKYCDARDVTFLEKQTYSEVVKAVPPTLQAVLVPYQPVGAAPPPADRHDLLPHEGDQARSPSPLPDDEPDVPQVPPAQSPLRQDHLPRALRLNAPGRRTAIPAPIAEGYNSRPRAAAMYVQSADAAYALRTKVYLAAATIPKNYHEAVQGTDVTLWKEACQKELDSLEFNGTFTVVKSPPTKLDLIDTKWVFAVKDEAAGKRYKARVVARGFTQVPGLNYDETFSPVASYTTIRVFLSVAAARGWDIQQLDAVTAFLNAQLHEEIYVTPPDGYRMGNEVWKLHKALSGLEQAGREWWKTLAASLECIDLVSADADSCLWFSTSNHVLLITVVDDFAITGTSEAIEAVIKHLEDSFAMKRMGELKLFVGLQITRDRAAKTISIGQQRYIDKLLDRFSTSNFKHINLPIPAKQHFQHATELDELVDPTFYLQHVGSIMFLMLASRPDLAFACALFSRYNRNPTTVHLAAVRRVLQYIASTRNFKLTLGGSTTITGYVDAAWADDRDTGRSSCGYVFTIGQGAVSWSSHLQSLVCKSTCEAELVAATSAASEAVWLAQLLSAFNIQVTPITLYGDNTGALGLAKNNKSHGRTKHLAVRWFFVRDLVEDNTIDFKYISTHDQLADALTKPVPAHIMSSFLKQCGLA